MPAAAIIQKMQLLSEMITMNPDIGVKQNN